MKKYVLIPLCICLILIVASGYYIYDRYETQLKERKELMISYIYQSKTQVEIVKMQVSKLPYIVKPIIGEIGKHNAEHIKEKCVENISLLQQFYVENDYFVKGISVYNMTGEVFNLYLYNNEQFIIDIYELRSVNIRDKLCLTIENKSFRIIIPVYMDNVLTGNVSININLISLLQELFKNYSENENLWTTIILDEETAVTFPEEGECELLHEKDIIKGVSVQKSGFIRGNIKCRNTSNKILTYFENFMIPDFNIGVAFSSNISPLISASIVAFVIIVAVLLLITAFAVYILNNIIVRNRKIITDKDTEIKLLHAIFDELPVSIMVTCNNRLFSGNSEFFTIFDGYISPIDRGVDINKLKYPTSFNQHSEHEIQDFDICKFERKGSEICLSRKHNSMFFDDDRYTIDAFWNITEIDRRLSDAVKSAVTKSELLNRVSEDFKNTLDKVRNASVSLMQQYPEEVSIAHIIKSTAESFDMLDDVQDYACIEAGLADIDEMPFNIVEEVNKLADKYHVEVLSKGLELQVHFSPSCISNVIGDPHHFRQILNELLRNAVRFTENGYIRISLETAVLQGEKVLVKCSVDDTGYGMSREKIKSLSTFDISTIQDGDTMGLCIIITKKIVDLMGGTLRMTSPSPISTDPENPGMQFLFSIICFAEKQFNKKLDYSSIVSWNQLNVLIITSNANITPYLINFLRHKGVSPDFYHHNAESDDLLMQKLIIDKNRYQVVFIAEKDNKVSFAIAEKIYDSKLTDNCIYAFVDTNSKKGNYIRAKSLNMDYYIVKSNYLSVYDSILKTHFPNLS